MPNKCQQMSGHVSGSVDVLIPTGRGSRLTRQGDRPSNYSAAVCQPSVPNVVTVKHCYDIGRRTWALYEKYFHSFKNCQALVYFVNMKFRDTLQRLLHCVLYPTVSVISLSIRIIQTHSLLEYNISLFCSHA